MKNAARSRTSLPSQSAFTGFRFPPDVIVLAVRWYLRYGLSFRNIEELLAERGIEVDHVTVYRWVQRFTPLFADAARSYVGDGVGVGRFVVVCHGVLEECLAVALEVQ